VCGSTSGNFRFLDFGQFGSAALSTTNNCGNGSQDTRIRQNIAMGVDHDLSIFGTTHTTEVVDTDACVPPQVLSPNAMFSRTGNQSNDATLGLFTGVAANFPDGDPARLARFSPDLLGGSAPARIDVLGVQDVDNTPLWLFIPPSYGPTNATADIPFSCERSQFVNGSGAFSIANTPSAVQTFLQGRTQGDQSIALLQRCFSHYMGQNWTGFPIGSLSTPEPPSGCTGNCDSPIFALNSTETDPELYDIQLTPRFGYVPKLNGFGAGNSVSRIEAFRAVYIQRLLIENSNTTWDPGVSPAPPTTGTVNRVGETSIFIFPPGSLPNGLADANAPYQLGANRFVRLVR
jgi:hypothetical protein